MNYETGEAWALGALGFIKGLHEVYLSPNLNAKRAWLTMGLGILAYEAVCPRGQLLSEGVDRALEAHKWLTRGAIGYTAAHLLNLIPNNYDPLHLVAERRFFGSDSNLS